MINNRPRSEAVTLGYSTSRVKRMPLQGLPQRARPSIRSAPIPSPLPTHSRGCVHPAHLHRPRHAAPLPRKRSLCPREWLRAVSKMRAGHRPRALCAHPTLATLAMPPNAEPLLQPEHSAAHVARQHALDVREWSGRAGLAPAGSAHTDSMGSKGTGKQVVLACSLACHQRLLCLASVAWERMGARGGRSGLVVYFSRWRGR
jgi:hypothetical protein